MYSNQLFLPYTAFIEPPIFSAFFSEAALFLLLAVLVTLLRIIASGFVARVMTQISPVLEEGLGVLHEADGSI